MNNNTDMTAEQLADHLSTVNVLNQTGDTGYLSQAEQEAWTAFTNTGLGFVKYMELKINQAIQSATAERDAQLLALRERTAFLISCVRSGEQLGSREEWVLEAVHNTHQAAKDAEKRIALKHLEAIAGVAANHDDLEKRPVHWAQGFDAGKTACFAALQALIQEGNK